MNELNDNKKKDTRQRTAGQDKRLEWWNNVVYNTMAPLYNSLDWLTCGIWWSLVRRAMDYIIIPPLPQHSSSKNNNNNNNNNNKCTSNILEVGFGPGRLFEEMASVYPDANLDGIDLAEGMCNFTKRRLQLGGFITTDSTVDSDNRKRNTGSNKQQQQQRRTIRITRGSCYDMPYRDETFDVIVTTFAFSGLKDGSVALQEMVRVLKSGEGGGRLIIVDIGLPIDKNRIGTFWAKLWEWCGDYLYDIPQMMTETGLKVVTLEEFGPGKHIRAVVGEKPRIAKETL